MPTITPSTTNAALYTVDDSTLIDVVFKLNFTDFAPRTINLTYPTGAAGLSVKLTFIEPPSPPTSGGPGDITRTTLDITAAGVGVLAGSGGSWNVSRTIGAGVDPGTSQNSVSIEDALGTGGVDKYFQLIATTTAASTWKLSVEADSNNDVLRVICDPTAVVAPIGDPLETSLINISASAADATMIVDGGVRLPWATPVPPARTVTYAFGHSGALVISDLPSLAAASSTLPVNLPGVYGNTAAPVHVTARVRSNDARDPFDYSRLGPDTPMTIKSRPQRAVLVLDRSGSMLGEPWELAKTSAQLFVQLFGDFREGANALDKIALARFEDQAGGFRNPSPPTNGVPDPTFVATIRAPGAPGTVKDELPTIDFGTPFWNTPIGDGLVHGMKLLVADGLPDDRRDIIVLLTDGQENSGTVRLEAPAVLPPVAEQAKLFATRRNEPDLTGVGPEDKAQIFAIALGSAPDLGVLASISGAQQFVATNTAGLANAFLAMLKNSQEFNQLATRNEREPGSGVSTNEIFFTTTSPTRFATALLKGTFAMELTRWDPDLKDYVAVPVTIENFPGHHYAGVTDASAFPGSTFWRVRHMNGATAEALALTDVLAYEDLHVKSDLRLDKLSYETGGKMNLTVRIRHDAEPVVGATVRAVLDAPAEGFGALVAGLGDADLAATKRKKDDDGKHGDHAIGRGALLQAILDKHGWKELPREHCGGKGLFVDGTDLLHDKDGTGIYTNTFAKVDKPGAYNWRVLTDGTDTDGEQFNHQLDQTVLATVGVSARKTLIRKERADARPPEQAVKVTITPRDENGEPLGPGFDRTVAWELTHDAKFQHVIKGEPAPVLDNGDYTRTIVFRAGRHPRLKISVNGTLLPVVDVAHPK
ncbi:hypothetical protein Afil01_34280 [Actinorhabdospora filicis]|uniref:VWFA domain-containing protein n=1 Tax=Actinorhabdospora filicis TaxID=1785913 RepID=A0A9W6WAH9_9ACTN|nr:vWA domain-containing protein [Actinorhabdospora filicis]GLZ78621.1 hypothetical protein Afil01_34280 [Actinorhabdospora filicis]